MSASIPFWKVQSIGNDFPLVHLDDVRALAQQRPSSEDFLLASLAVQMCDRRFGVGGDGLLALGREADGLRLRMFNPDGTEDFCGNGIRCAAWHAVRQQMGAMLGEIVHLERRVPYEVLDDRGLVRTTLGPADYTPSKVPHTAGRELFNETVWSGMDAGMPLSLFGSALTTGSTHVVIGTYALPDDDSFRSVSAKIEVADTYPQRTSVIWRREVAPMVLEVRIWERGVGETLGCGTGSAAAVADYLRGKRSGGRVEVRSPGGVVVVSASAWDAPLTLEAVAQEVYRGEYRIRL